LRNAEVVLEVANFDAMDWYAAFVTTAKKSLSDGQSVFAIRKSVTIQAAVIRRGRSRNVEYRAVADSDGVIGIRKQSVWTKQT
jgi:hypothetical protein